MKPKTLFCALLLVATTFKIAAATPLATVNSLKNKKILILGDSITQAGTYATFIEYYLLKTYPKDNFDIISVGLASETINGMTEKRHPFPRPNLLDRLDAALKMTKPDVVFACYGMNDGIYHPLDDKIMNSYKKGISTLIKKVKAIGAKLVLLTPPFFDVEVVKKKALDHGSYDDYSYVHPYIKYNDETLVAFSKYLKTLNKNILVVDLNEPMKNFILKERTSNPKFKFAKDGIHPNPLGHLLMAMTILKALDADIKPDKDLNKELAKAQSDPLFKLVQKARKTRSNAWLRYIGYTRGKTVKSNSVDKAEKTVSKLMTQIDTIRRSQK